MLIQYLDIVYSHEDASLSLDNLISSPGGDRKFCHK